MNEQYEDDALPENGDGDCFKVAAEVLMYGMKVGPEVAQKFVLCHGLVVGQGKLGGVQFTHAWLEDAKGKMCFDFSNGNEAVIPLPIYYHIGSVEGVVRYTPQQVGEMLLTHGHYGPWDKSLDVSPRRIA